MNENRGGQPTFVLIIFLDLKNKNKKQCRKLRTGGTLVRVKRCKTHLLSIKKTHFPSKTHFSRLSKTRLLPLATTFFFLNGFCNTFLTEAKLGIFKYC